jgi:hypothetical protein
LSHADVLRLLLFLPSVQCTSCSTFKYFNPITPAAYRESLARWLVTMLLSIEHAANNP